MTAPGDIRILALFGARVIFGQERANIEALCALQRQGCRVLCVIRDEDWPEIISLRQLLESRDLAWTPASFLDYPIRGWILHSLKRNPAAFLRGNKTLLHIAHDFGPTHIHASNPMYVASFWFALTILRLPLIYRAGDRPILHNTIYRILWRSIVTINPSFVADSAYIRDCLIDTGVSAENIDIIRSPPPIRVNSKPLQLAPHQPDELRFLYVGRISLSKGVNLLVDAFKAVSINHPNVMLYIAGPITDWREDDWARELFFSVQRDPELSGRIHFLGHVEDIVGLMRACDVLVAPSVHTEAYGLVVVEAKSAGLPAIVFPTGGLPELIEHGVDGVVTSGKSAFHLEAALTFYIHNPILVARHKDAATRSINKLDFCSFDSSWLTVYEKRGNRRKLTPHV